LEGEIMTLAKINKGNRIFKIKETSEKIDVGCGICFVSKKSDENLECYERKSDKSTENKK
jgi:hypothetical protein